MLKETTEIGELLISELPEALEHHSLTALEVIGRVSSNSGIQGRSCHELSYTHSILLKLIRPLRPRARRT